MKVFVRSITKSLLPMMQSHIEKWGQCTLCSLSESRFQPVLFRGTVPCQVLFIGEAPGDVENLTGFPFHERAPAGSILCDIIRTTGGDGITIPLPGCKDIPACYSYAITNTVACHSEGPPPDECRKACVPRLAELISMCHPKLLVAVGKVAESTIIKEVLNKQTKMTVMDHPSWILRQEDMHLHIQRNILNLVDALVDAKCAVATSFNRKMLP